MKKMKFLNAIFIVFLVFGILGSQSVNAQETPKIEAKVDQKQIFEKIEQLIGAKGKFNEKEGVFKVSFPRSDLDVKVGGVKMTPPMGLTAWAAFKMMGDHTMMMGDMVLTEDQVNPVMSVALDNGLEVTALHNHFFWDSPKVMLGEMNSGVYKVTIGRTTKMSDHEMGNTMGVNTWAAFVGSDEKAVVDGDFAMLESEVQAVLKALRAANINIVAIHNHMTGESPRIIFLHFWGIDSTTNLAKGLKAALDTQHLEKA
ncbi:MAG: DUF1259 domain-containing protein [Planctomycetes bacterium]|nr:DUF1259 domain-containing protein [Planctomycetota bacterium]